MAVTLNASTSSGFIQSADTSGVLQLQSNGTTQQTIDSTGSYGQLKLGTAWTYTSGTPSNIDFTNIPSWVKRITVQITGLSFAAAGAGVIQIGSGLLTTTGYTGFAQGLSAGPTANTTSVTNGFGTFATSAAATTIIGSYVLTNVTGNQWLATGQTIRGADSVANWGYGFITLSGTLDRLSLVATTSTFDAGTINILYEG